MRNFTWIYGRARCMAIDIYIFSIQVYITKLVVAVSALLYSCTTWTLTKRMEKRLDGNYTKMLQAILNKPWKQLPTKIAAVQLLTFHLKKIIHIKRTGQAGQCWRNKDKLISDVLLWTFTHGHASIGRLDLQTSALSGYWMLSRRLNMWW